MRYADRDTPADGDHLTPHFRLSELCRTDTGVENEPLPSLAGNLLRLAETLEQVRSLIGCPMRITSGYRSERLNELVGGVATSDHLWGRAADFVPLGRDARECFESIQASEIPFKQLILEHRAGVWMHISVPPAREEAKRETLEAYPNGLGGMRYAHV